MRYIFYGRIEVTEYNPCILDYYGCKVPSLGAFNRFVSYDEFFRKDNVHAEIKAGTRIDIYGESVYINNIQYDIIDDSYKCYTEKVLCRGDGRMSKAEAEEKLEALQNRGFFKKLFGR